MPVRMIENFEHFLSCTIMDTEAHQNCLLKELEASLKKNFIVDPVV
jgi:hypothetical protein